MISSTVARLTALLLLVLGVLFLFVPDELLPYLIPGFPPSAAWVGQLIGGAWIGLASITWSHRRQPLGGIYARPVTYANTLALFIGGTALCKAALGDATRPATWALAAPIEVLALVWLVLLLKGPFDRGLDR